MDVIRYNRLLKQKQYKITQHRLPTLFKKLDYELKIKSICNAEHCDHLPTEYLIDLEGRKKQTDHDYVNYLFYRHLNKIVGYIAENGIQLIDIEWNIKLILDEIVNGKVKESYYEKTIDIYDDISGGNINIYDVIDRALDFNNIKMLYYIYYMEEEIMLDRVCEAIYKE